MKFPRLPRLPGINVHITITGPVSVMVKSDKASNEQLAESKGGIPAAPPSPPSEPAP